MKISAVILTKNEEKNIEECLKSLCFCDEKIVIDDNSIDKTQEIARRNGAKVFIHSLDDNFSKQRNFGMSKAKNDWVLFVDADERVPEPLMLEISGLKFEEPRYTGFYIKRKDVIWGKELEHGETGNVKLLRLAKRDSGEWIGKIHEIWDIKKNTSALKNSLIHYPHQTLDQFLKEINYYTDIRVEELYKKGKKVHWWSIILYPKLKFFINYFLKRGFLDGIPGLVFAVTMSLHSFLVRGKLWLLWKEKN